MTELDKITAAMQNRKPIDEDATRELVLYAENDSMTYHYSALPACENLIRKVKRGQYDAVKAVKLFEYVAEYAAKHYAKEFARPEDWHKIFTVDTRRHAAIELSERYQDYINDEARRA